MARRVAVMAALLIAVVVVALLVHVGYCPTAEVTKGLGCRD